MPPAPRITTLIDKLDSVEVVRDEIAAILKLESANQETLASQAGKDPQERRLRVFVDRANPWEQWIDGARKPGGADVDPTPIVNVWFDGDNFDKGSSDVIERQKATATYNIDCYGYGVSEETAEGHSAADETAVAVVMRVRRLVRNILMAAAYTYLGQAPHERFVWGRWVQSTRVFQPMIGDRPVQRVAGLRVTFEVDLNEFSPQIEGHILTLISSTVKRAETGEVLLVTDFDLSDS